MLYPHQSLYIKFEHILHCVVDLVDDSILMIVEISKINNEYQ